MAIDRFVEPLAAAVQEAIAGLDRMAAAALAAADEIDAMDGPAPNAPAPGGG